MIPATKKQGLEIEPIEEGSYPARVYQVLHLGTYPDFTGTLKNKVRIGFELPTEMMVFDKEKGEQPRVISQEYTLSFHEKATLTKVIKACDPKALSTDDDGFLEVYDVEKLVGKACLVTVIHKEGKDKNIYANVGGVTVMPKGMTCADAINPPQILNFDNFNEELFNKLPDFIKNKIISSEEYKTLKGISVETDEVEPF